MKNIIILALLLSAVSIAIAETCNKDGKCEIGETNNCADCYKNGGLYCDLDRICEDGSGGEHEIDNYCNLLYFSQTTSAQCYQCTLKPYESCNTACEPSEIYYYAADLTGTSKNTCKKISYTPPAGSVTASAIRETDSILLKAIKTIINILSGKITGRAALKDATTEIYPCSLNCQIGTWPECTTKVECIKKQETQNTCDDCQCNADGICDIDSETSNCDDCKCNNDGKCDYTENYQTCDDCKSENGKGCIINEDCAIYENDRTCGDCIKDNELCCTTEMRTKSIWTLTTEKSTYSGNKEECPERLKPECACYLFKDGREIPECACGNGLCEPSENEVTCQQDCICKKDSCMVKGAFAKCPGKCKDLNSVTMQYKNNQLTAPIEIKKFTLLTWQLEQAELAKNQNQINYKDQPLTQPVKLEVDLIKYRTSESWKLVYSLMEIRKEGGGKDDKITIITQTEKNQIGILTLTECNNNCGTKECSNNNKCDDGTQKINIQTQEDYTCCINKTEGTAFLNANIPLMLGNKNYITIYLEGSNDYILGINNLKIGLGKIGADEEKTKYITQPIKWAFGIKGTYNYPGDTQ